MTSAAGLSNGALASLMIGRWRIVGVGLDMAICDDHFDAWMKSRGQDPDQTNDANSDKLS